jgi:crotonobetaine/carnitine-CoA ligase
MPYFAAPRYLDFLETLPTTENGKVQKFLLRERGVGSSTFDAAKIGYKVAR